MMGQTTTASIWTQLSDNLRQFIRRRVADEHVAEDLLQETFMRIHRSIKSLNEADRLAAWVYQIARNVINDHYRKSSSQDTVALDANNATEEVDNASNHSRGRTCEWLDELIGQLPADYRDAVHMSEIEGLTQQTIADRVGLSLSGAKSRIQRGRAMLKEVLDQCCTFQFDRRGNLIDVDPKPDRTVCKTCDEDPNQSCS